MEEKKEDPLKGEENVEYQIQEGGVDPLREEEKVNHHRKEEKVDHHT